MRRFPDMHVAKALVLAGAVITLSATQSHALSIEFGSSWVNEGSYGSIVATDCAAGTCGRNIEIACQGEGSPAIARITGLASERRFPALESPVSILVDGQRFTRSATTAFDPNYGFVPQFVMAPDDPLVEALAAGQNVDFVFSERDIFVSLYESRSALSVFVAHCGWQQAQARAASNISQAAAPTGAAGIYDRRRRGYVLGCANTPGLNGRTAVLNASNADRGHVSFRLPDFTDNGRAFSPPEMGNLSPYGDVFVDLFMIEGGNPSDWQLTMRPSASGSYTQGAQMELEVPDYGMISCRADAIF